MGVNSSHCSEDDVVNSLDDIYKVGTFVHILEMGQSDRDNRVRMIIKGIRRHAVTVFTDC